MKLIQNSLYLTISECVECGMNEETIKCAKRRDSNCWNIIDDPDDKRRVLVGFDKLSPARKRDVEVRFGNPYDLVARTPILAMVESDWKACDYFRGYRYGANLSLPGDRVNQYTRAASWLNMLKGVKDKKAAIKKELGLMLTEFYIHVQELISLEKERGKLKGYAGLDVLPGDFPSSYQRLMAKVEGYKTGGYDSLIDPLFGNKNAAKIGKVPSLGADMEITEGVNAGYLQEAVGINEGLMMQNEPQKAVLVQKSVEKTGGYCPDLAKRQIAIIRHTQSLHNNLDAGQVAKFVNYIFKQNGWKTLSRARIHDIMSENKHLTTSGNRGTDIYRNEIAMQMKRKAPDAAMKYWTLDGWMVELMYQQPGVNKKGHKVVDYKRLTAVIVIDAFNKYPVGYAIGEQENTDLIREANRNALLHTKELFGNYYRPAQLQSDNYGNGNLVPFYQAITNLYVPARVGNSKAKVIEPYFMYLNKEYCQIQPNWTGFNLDSKKANQVNREMTDKMKGSFPDKAGVIKQIERIIDRERAKKVDAFMAAYAPVQHTPMNDMDWLNAFSVPVGKTNSITGQGIIKTIKGVEYTYDSFEPQFRANRHLDWQVKVDEYDMSKALVESPDGKLRFVVYEKRAVPMDIASMLPEDHQYLAHVTKFNKDREAEVMQTLASDADITRQVVLDTHFEGDDELALKMRLTYAGQQKDRLNKAKNNAFALTQKKEQRRIADVEADNTAAWEEKQRAYQDSKVDFSSYQ